jgi:hypothetical protein
MASVYAKKLAAKAISQHQTFHLLHEGDPPLATQIKRYWLDLGLSFPGVKTAWSAVFVSWCVLKAGATSADFKFAQAHSVFVHQAIKNQVAQTGLFRAIEINLYAPAVGDIIHNNRSGHTFNYAFAKANPNYESHSAIVVETGEDEQGKYALTVGGNESDSVRRKLVRLKPNGLIKQRTIDPYICVIKNLK